MNIIVLLILCVALMFTLMLTRRKHYNISTCKTILLTVCVAALGVLGTYIMYFIENGEWGGQSFFGAVLFFPILLAPLTRLFQLKLTEILDFATPAGLSLLVPFKLNCYLAGCCGGKALWYSENGVPTHFPSQFVEMAVALVLTVILLIIERRKRFQGKIYPICIILYGCSRCLLNQFRSEQLPYVMGLTAGEFWSTISVGIGLVWLLIDCVITSKSERKN